MGERQPRLGEITRTFGATVAAIAVIGLTGYGIFGDSAMDVMGDESRDRTEDEAREIAVREYGDMFQTLSPADMFTVQYAGITKYRVDARPDGSGILGTFSEGSEDFEVIFNDGCLANTAYDINGGELSISLSTGLFVRTSATAEADIPSAAAFVELDPENSDRIRVASGNSNSSDLSFSGIQGREGLVPADEQTERILETYGCEDNLVETSLNGTVYLDQAGLYESL